MRVAQNSSGFLRASEDLESEAKFLPLLTQLALRSLQQPAACLSFVVMPYDFYCPSVQTDLKERCCEVCGLYHASKKAAGEHQKLLEHRPRFQSARVRPVRLVAKRRGELLCEMDGPALDWVDEEDVDVDGLELADPDLNDQLPLAESLEEWLTSPWMPAAGN